MALELTENLKQELLNSKITPVLVFKIDGFDKVFNNTLIKSFIKIGDPGVKIGEPIPPGLTVWTIGGYKFLAEQSPFVNFNIGTTTRINQKLDPSRGLGSSVSQMTIVMVDPNEEITEFISPGFTLPELLGRRASIYLGTENSTWPDDYNVVFRGNIQDLESGPGFISFFLNNTEERKRQTILAPITAKTAERVLFRSNKIQSLFYSNAPGITDLITIQYIAISIIPGAEIVTVVGTTITVQMSASTKASDMKKAIEGSLDASQLVKVEIDGDKEEFQTDITFTLGSSTDITLDDASAFFEAEDSGTLEPYVKIGDELIGYETISSNVLNTLVRGAFNSVTANADVDADVSQFIRLKGNAIDLILKLLLSTGPQFYVEALDIESIGVFESYTIDNAIFFKGFDVEQEYGVSEGDFVNLTGCTNPTNDITDVKVISTGKVIGGSYIVVADNLISEIDSPGIISIRSQFNTLSIGVGLLPNEVDVKQHLFIRDTFLQIIELDLLTDSIPNGKEYIETQLYLPISCYSVPRKGRSSIVYQIPPIATNELIYLNTKTVANPQSLRIRRSLAENFFNQVIFQADYDPISNESKAIFQYDSLDSQSRIPVGYKPLTVNSHALRSTSDAAVLTSRTANKLLRRYQYGAEYIKNVRVLFGIGFQVEIGDAIAVDFTDLKLSDTKTGTRAGDVRLMEVLNKTLDAKTGEIYLDLVDTTFGVDDRLGLISPSTLTDVGSTTTKLIMKQSFSTKPFERESTKWEKGGYIGQTVTVRTLDFTSSYETTIVGFDNNTPQGMLVSPLPVAPGADWVIGSPRYPDSALPATLSFWKLRHAFFSPQLQVSNAVAISQSKFKLSPTDILVVFLNSVVKIHSYDYSDNGTERKIIDIDYGTNTVTLSGNVGFSIDDSHFVDLIGFPDKGSAYRII